MKLLIKNHVRYCLQVWYPYGNTRLKNDNNKGQLCILRQVKVRSLTYWAVFCKPQGYLRCNYLECVHCVPVINYCISKSKFINIYSHNCLKP